MTVLAAGLPSIDDLATAAAAGPLVKDYLADRGIATCATLALLARDESALERILIQPLQSGWKKSDGATLTAESSEHPIIAAIITHMWQSAKSAWDAHLSNNKAVAATSSSTTPASGAASTAAEDKPPKSL